MLGTDCQEARRQKIEREEMKRCTSEKSGLI